VRIPRRCAEQNLSIGLGPFIVLYPWGFRE
jgi:hypothetical protein